MTKDTGYAKSKAPNIYPNGSNYLERYTCGPFIDTFTLYSADNDAKLSQADFDRLITREYIREATPEQEITGIRFWLAPTLNGWVGEYYAIITADYERYQG